MSATKTRLDQHLVNLGLFDSRAQSAAAIKAKQVTVNGVAARKSSQMVSSSDVIIAAPAHGYVSRGGLKLEKGLDHFQYPIEGKTVIDIGASTGGFSDVALQKGAAHILAVDVGRDQLHRKLRKDARVTNFEGLNARHITPDTFDREIDALVCDVSFISLELALNSVLDNIVSGGWALALIKPQFEAGKSNLGKNGVVSDQDMHAKICARIEAWFAAHPSGWQVDGIVQSPIKGPQGNTEFLIGARKTSGQ